MSKGLKVGDIVTLPPPTPAAPTIATGQPASVVLLRPTGEGTFRVERLVHVE